VAGALEETSMRWTSAFLVVLTLLASPALAQSDEVRIDTFDKHGRRTGYLILNEKTGRIDQYDARSNRLGFGTVTSPPSSSNDRMYDQNGRSIIIDRRAR
jgi:hypothetical protein